MIIEAIIILVSVGVGWFLRDLRAKAIKEKVGKVKLKVFPRKSRVLDWTPPKSGEEIAEEKVKENLKL